MLSRNAGSITISDIRRQRQERIARLFEFGIVHEMFFCEQGQVIVLICDKLNWQVWYNNGWHYICISI